MRGHKHRQGTKNGQPTWRLVVDAGTDPVTRKRRQVTRTFRGSEKKANTELARLVAQVDEGRHAGTAASVGYLLERWLEHAALQPMTRDDYRSVIRCHLRPALEDIPVHRLKAADLDRLYDRLGTRIGPARVRRVHTVIRSALAQAVRWEWASTNVALSASPPPVPRPNIHPPTPDQVGRLLAASESDPALLAFVYLAAATGARPGELCGIQWGDLDAAAGTLTIRRSVSTPTGGIVVKETKTGKVRTIALNKQTLKVLATWRIGWQEQRLTHGLVIEDTAFVFARDRTVDTPWRPSTAAHRFEKVREVAGVPDVDLRDLRHYVATQLIAAGVDPVTVSGRLGHDRTSTTVDMYAHWQPARDREAADILGGLLPKAR